MMASVRDAEIDSKNHQPKESKVSLSRKLRMSATSSGVMTAPEKHPGNWNVVKAGRPLPMDSE